MTLVTGTVQDLGYDGMEGTLWARPARFRSDGQVVYAPERKPHKIEAGQVSADLAPGPAVLELQVGSHARGTFEVVIPEEDTTLADLLDTVFAWEPEQVSLFVAEREAAQQAAADAETAAGTATTAAQQTGQDRAHVDSIRDLLDEAAQTNVAPYLTETALNATYGHEVGKTLYNPVTGLREMLDIWDEFSVIGSVSLSWDASNYAGWIAGIDARLNGAAQKETIGISGTETIHAYTAGGDGVPHALIVGGTHPGERQSMHAAMRYFTEFATSSHPVMVAMRTQLRITWIPCLTASQYNVGRPNADGIDVNRNFDFYWKWYDDDITEGTKGTAPMSTTEAQAIASLLAAQKIACVIDCHMLGNSGSHIRHIPPSSWTVGQRALGLAAASVWDQTYNVDGAVEIEEMGTGATGASTLRNWSAHYMRTVRGFTNAFATTLEARNDTAGTDHLFTSRQFMRYYCGLVHLHLVEWLENGQKPAPAYAHEYDVALTAPRLDVGIADQGALINTQTRAPLWWNNWRGSSGSNDYVKSLDFPIPATGVIYVDAWLMLESDASMTTPEQVQYTIGWGETPVEGGDVQAQSANFGYVDVPPAGARATATYSNRFGTGGGSDVGTLRRVQFYLRNMQAGKLIRIRGFVMKVRWVPNVEAERIPMVQRSS